MSSPSSSGRAPPLPEAMSAELARIGAQLGQTADPRAVDRLARLGEDAAWRVLGALAEKGPQVKNVSAFLTHLVKNEELRRNAVGVPTAQSAVRCLGPFRSPQQEVSIPGPPHQYRIPMEVESQVTRMVTGPSNQARIEPISPVRWMHHMVEEEVQSPQCLISPGLQHQSHLSPAAHPMANRGATRDFSPSPVRHISQRVQQMCGPSGRAGMVTPYPLLNGNSLRAKASPQMLALGELNFDRFFLIQVYLADKKIEDIIQDASYIRYLNSLPMDLFESEIWDKFGEKLILASDRRKNLDWDPSKARLYHCNIEKKDDSIVTTFKGPYLENTRTHLQKVVGDNNVLIVNFAEIPVNTNSTNNYDMYYTFYQHVGKDGILLGLRRYRFFVYKDNDGGNEKKYKGLKKEEEKSKNNISSAKCYFVRTESGWESDEPYILSGYTIDQARSLFMHIHTAPTVAKYLSRFSLILSKTITLDLDFMKVHVQTIDDEPCKDDFGEIVIQHGKRLIHTDGTGLISVDLATKCPNSVFRGKFLNDAVDSKELQYSTVEYPLLMQFRMFYNGFAVKGTLLVDKRLPPETICIRPSMIKIYPDPKLLDQTSFNSLEIVTTSHRPRRGHTSRMLIALLHYGGVKAEYFVYLLSKALEDVKKTRHTTRDSLEVAFNHADLDNSMSARMILSGIQPENEAYLKYQLDLMTMLERKGLREGRIPIDESYYLIGTTDPTGTLKQDQVCVILDHGQVSGKVLVYKPPGLHFGDIHVLTATYIDGLEKVVGNSKYAIFFPTCGPRSLADEMANSDFDGDTYWVSRDPQLLEQFRQSAPWVQPEPKKDVEQKKPDQYDVYALEELLFNEFLKARFTPSYVKGQASNCWLQLMDRLLTENVPESEQRVIKKSMCDLVDIYYSALDASKEGRKVSIPNDLVAKTFPHFMERGENCSYNSTSVLGRIYDEVKSQQESETVSPVQIVPLECFNQEVVSEERKSYWRCRYKDEYLKESKSICNMVADKKLRNIKFKELYQKYKDILYGPAGEFEGSQKSRSQLFEEACAIYQVVYEEAIPRNEVSKCGFVWKVAGRALCTFYVLKSGGDTALCSFPVLEEVLKRNQSRAGC